MIGRLYQHAESFTVERGDLHRNEVKRAYHNMDKPQVSVKCEKQQQGDKVQDTCQNRHIRPAARVKEGSEG
ncbi:Uncharacterised protein [Klebsiella pneumoniae]|nr:Uncharacterised protein [Klebsiella pneumoniae]